ncbi:MAG: hypothetical protein CMP76_10790 [Flavobacterium sp.]|uniref:DUF4136 domain-containing protein n=1 Tax=Flavobacterium sp. TaxID=239 RepID=UPI000C3E2B2F|nr:DUF4136 domain-containing protein [Flavobacterium sp.]MBF03770.1 hypothetical protein [Flavobacterium sp.]|tara:strand:+ start:650 stop:1180 length:531 start_codon:yes stop_codon:yes gene_type:complete
MKTLKFITLGLLFIFVSCSSVRVNADYDKNVDFANYNTYAYLKSSIDKAEISDLDKKRILRSIDEVMSSKGFAKSENPSMLISIFTKERERVDVYNNAGFGWGWGWGWNPYWGMNYNRVYTTPEGTLFIDVIDAKTKELVWQGEGSGYLTKDTNKKDERIMEFVSKILAQYPPTHK